MKKYLNFVKFSHSIFAMPFALLGFFIAVNQNTDEFDIWILIYVVLAMIFARNAAMGFNRYLDRDIDAKNPRTASREIPSGQLSESAALSFIVINCILFLITAFLINYLCFLLAPIALIVILGYSYTKRFTWFCHLVLGVGLAIAPIGAYLAISARMEWNMLFLAFAVMTWVAGFDVVYALQDETFDKNNKLQSIPARWGVVRSIWMSICLHFISAILISYFGYWLLSSFDDLYILTILATLLFIFLLAYQHIIIGFSRFHNINKAFFTLNGMASLAYGLLIIIDLYL